jgi:Tfp pilus tip-associated adhesin PilY1
MKNSEVQIIRPLVRTLPAILIAGCIAFLPTAELVHADDTDLFRSSVPPNVMIVVDNSKSMNQSVTHPGYSGTTSGVDNKAQTNCRAFRDASNNSHFAIYNAGVYKPIFDPNGKNVRGKNSDDGYGPIMSETGIQAIFNPTSSNSKAGDPLYYKVDSTDQGRGLAYYYDTGNPILDGGGTPMYWASGGNVPYLEMRLYPREPAVANGLDPMTLEFTAGASICDETSVPLGWSLWAGDPSITIPNGSTMKVKLQYLDYLFSDIGGDAREAVFDPSFANDGKRTYSSCLGLTPPVDEYDVYRRTRLLALHKILATVICEVNQEGDVRFGVSQFRFRGGGGIGTAADGDVQGGYAVLPIQDFKVWDAGTSAWIDNRYDLHDLTNASHAEHIDDVISRVGPDSTTPLAETLFQVYTYFMSREYDKLPYGRDSDGVSTGVKFPVYSYDTRQPDDSDPKDLDEVGGHFLSLSGNDANPSAPPSPVENWCQKNFVLFITDGGSFMDSFLLSPGTWPLTDPTDTGQGYDDFLDLIGDHYLNADGTPDETEYVADSKRSQYIDDIAYFMNRWDFLPDETEFPGDQTIDVYTVGYAMEAGDDAGPLERAAINGNGIYFESADADQLAEDLVTAIADMIDKAQSFTSATVPSSRTADGNNFYSSYFKPESSSPFWDGHLRVFDFTISGDILTASGNCAVGTDIAATPPCDESGILRINAEPFWDASDQIPAPSSRKLYVGKGDTSFLVRPPLWSSVDRDDLGLLVADLIKDPYLAAITSSLRTAIDGLGAGDDIESLASDAEDSHDALTTMIINNIKGCVFNTDCTTRTNSSGDPSLLGDIFHSNPVVVGSPNSAINETSYKYFRNLYVNRTRVIYAGSNDGWLHGFNAGTYQTTDPSTGDPLTIPAYDRGTGVEEFAYMPSHIRRTIRDLRVETSFPRSWYGVDGSPISADVWMYRRTETDGAVDPTLPTGPIPKTASQWKSILLGSLREGGAAYYALDVTDPSDSSNYPGYLWDFPCDPDDCASAVNDSTEDEADYMSQTWSEPVITRLRVKGNSDGYTGPGYERWVAIFGAGYSPKGDPNSSEYEDDVNEDDAKLGRAIYIVDITTGEVLAKKYFSPIAEFGWTTQMGFPEMRYAVASQPAVYDIDFDGFADIIFIGDIGGNLWKWVVTDLGDDPINNSSYNRNMAQPNWPFRLFFRAPAVTEPVTPGTAPDFSLVGNVFRSIFFPPTAVLRSGKLLLAFGTGQRANIQRWDADGDTSNNNRFFVVRDPYPLENGVSTPDPLVDYLTESDLASNDELNSETCTNMTADYDGYVIEARDAEKFVTNSVIFLGDVITGTFIPVDPTVTNPCEASGTAYLYRFDVDCGGGSYTSDPGGSNAQRRAICGNGIPTRPRVSAGELSGGSSGGDPCANRVVVVTSDGSVSNECQGSASTSGVRLRSWRQR